MQHVRASNCHISHSICALFIFNASIYKNSVNQHFDLENVQKRSSLTRQVFCQFIKMKYCIIMCIHVSHVKSCY